MSTVEFVKELTGWQGSACLVRKGAKYFIVSSVTAPITGFETLVFPARADGSVISYGDVAGGRGMSREEAITDLATSEREQW